MLSTSLALSQEILDFVSLRNAIIIVQKYNVIHLIKKADCLKNDKSDYENEHEVNKNNKDTQRVYSRRS